MSRDGGHTGQSIEEGKMFRILCDAFVGLQPKELAGFALKFLLPICCVAVLLFIALFILVRGIVRDIEKKKPETDNPQEEETK